MDAIKIVFRRCVVWGNTPIIRLLIETCAGIRDHNLLYAAACCGHVSITRLLYTGCVADYHAVNFAARRGRTEIVSMLMAMGADPNIGGWDGYAIYTAAQFGYHETVKVLLGYPHGDPAQDYNAAIRLASGNGHIKTMKLLLADPRVDPAGGDNYAIRVSALKGHIGAVKLLLKDLRVNPSAMNNFALKKAIENGHEIVVKLLIKDTRISDIRSISSLVKAAGNGHVNVVKLMVESDLIAGIRSKGMHMLLERAFAYGQDRVLEFLLCRLGHSANITAYISMNLIGTEHMIRRIPNKLARVDKMFRDHMFGYYIVIREFARTHLVVDLLPLFL